MVQGYNLGKGEVTARVQQVTAEQVDRGEHQMLVEGDGYGQEEQPQVGYSSQPPVDAAEAGKVVLSQDY